MRYGLIKNKVADGGGLATCYIPELRDAGTRADSALVSRPSALAWRILASVTSPTR